MSYRNILFVILLSISTSNSYAQSTISTIRDILTISVKGKNDHIDLHPLTCDRFKGHLPSPNGDKVLMAMKKLILKEKDELLKDSDLKYWEENITIDNVTYSKDNFISFTLCEYSDNLRFPSPTTVYEPYTFIKRGNKIYLLKIRGCRDVNDKLRKLVRLHYDINCANSFSQEKNYNFFISKGKAYMYPINDELCLDAMQIDNTILSKI